ncbi:type 1 fimbrial protein [Serratia rubidaea]|nr:fimbrial protein [Serratia rubidaea]MBS0971934.1 type 1 fimbrial protein [Serratia rubidaea]MBS6089517.1 type 1 fimbrial protein [Serratia marcescens]HBH7557858.1 type 1 fimbrial protein [Serratia marcescens]HEJ0022554.1 type 1 fimbrial protein [Serratia marcescens]
MVPVVVGSLWALMPEACAAGNWNVDGANGVLHVRGALTESACRLEMTSAYQDVWLGETGTARLAEVGAQGSPVAVQLRLQDCLRAPVNNRDDRSGNLLWNAHQPAVSLSFVAPADADNPQLIAVRGASGVALRMVDTLGRDIRLGSRGAPLMLSVGQDTLDYIVTLERTHAPLQVGAYSAHADFRLNYD